MEYERGYFEQQEEPGSNEEEQNREDLEAQMMIEAWMGDYLPSNTIETVEEEEERFFCLNCHQASMSCLDNQPPTDEGVGRMELDQTPTSLGCSNCGFIVSKDVTFSDQCRD